MDTVTADEAYDARACHAATAAREATDVIPTRFNGRPWKETTPGAQARNGIPCATRRAGRPLRRHRSGPHRRRLTEAKMRRLQRPGERLTARTPDRQTAGFRIRAALLNRFTAPDTPETQRVA